MALLRVLNVRLGAQFSPFRRWAISSLALVFISVYQPTIDLPG
jgi:hypothetical protein